LYYFRIIADYLLKVADFNLPPAFGAPWWPRSNFAEIFVIRKL